MKRIFKIKMWMMSFIAVAFVSGVIYYYYNPSEIFIFGNLIGMIGFIGCQYELNNLEQK